MKKSGLNFTIWFVVLSFCVFQSGCLNPSKSKRLTKEDKSRMDVLQNDVLRKIDEIASITGRLLEKDSSPVSNFEIIISENRIETKAKITPSNDELASVYYCDPPGICTPDPCETANTQIPLTGRDSIQMKRLQKEIVAHIDEIGRIIGSTLGKKLSPVGKFSVTINGKGANRTVNIEMEPILIIGNGNGCYEDPPGICCECPC